PNDPSKEIFKEVDPRDSDRVFVNVAAYNSKVYYVQGEVQSPGRLPVTGKDTVLDALNYAGGMTPSARRDRVQLIPPRPHGRPPRVLPIAVAAVPLGADATANYQLMPGDRIVVPADPEPRPATEAGDPKLRDLERRLSVIEQKLDRVIKRLDEDRPPRDR